jgi:hypothetical protein
MKTLIIRRGIERPPSSALRAYRVPRRQVAGLTFVLLFSFSSSSSLSFLPHGFTQATLFDTAAT